MRVVPQQISMVWMETLTDDDLLEVEARLREQFGVIERREKKLKGDKYQLFRGSAELMGAWDRWSRLLAAARERSLNPLRERKVAAV